MKNKLIVFTFLIALFGLFFVNLFTPDRALSYSERRRLAQLPAIDYQKVMSGDAMDGFDKYATDQFIGREFFRGVKTFFDRNALLKRDTNGLFEAQGSIFTIEYPLREDKAAYLCARLNALYDTYLTGMNVYYTLIPDKNYYLPDDAGYLRMDYDKMAELVRQGMPPEAKYIDMFGKLGLSNYYQSDGHWRQETLGPVVDTLVEAMGMPAAFDASQYYPMEHYPFYGAYYGQLAGMADPDTLVWLESDVTSDAEVFSLSQPTRDDLKVYFEDGLGGMDSYDVFLYGAQPLIILNNTHNTSGRGLILVRDSYGSSLAPLLLDNYSRITIIDLRYITQELLAEFVTFEDQDVLIMYSTTIVNNSDIIR